MLGGTALWRAFSFVDERPVRFIVGASCAMNVAVVLVGLFVRHDVLLASLSKGTRQAVYGQFSTTGFTLLGAGLTALALLLTLPDRERVKTLREASDGWTLLAPTILMTAGISALTGVLAQLGIALDTDGKSIEWLSNVALGLAVSTLMSALITGVAFSLVIYAISKPETRINPRRSADRG